MNIYELEDGLWRSIFSPAVTLTFELQNLNRSSVWASGYSR